MKTELYRTNTKSHGLVPACFAFDNYYYCACSKASISINEYIQKAGEPEDDAGFLKHIAMQLNCSCYSYPSKPRLQVTGFY